MDQYYLMSVRQRTATAVGWTCFIVSCVWVMVVLLVEAPGDDTAWNAMYAVAFTGLGAVVLSRQPGNRAGWLLLAPVLLTISDASSLVEEQVDAASAGIDLWAGWTALTYVLGLYPLVVLLPFLLPDGRLLSSRWAPAFSAGCVLTALAAFSEALRAATGSGSISFDLTMYFFSGLCSIVGTFSLLLRVQRSRGQQRSQLVWLLLGLTIFLVIRGIQVAIYDFSWIEFPSAVETGVQFLGFILLLALPVTWGVAILRYRLVELNSTLHRLLLFGVLTTVVTAAFLTLSALLGAPSFAITATGVAMALVTPPLYGWLDGRVSRLIYGQRGSPGEVVASVVRRLGAAGPEEVLAVLADAVQNSMPPNVGVMVTLSTSSRELRRVNHGFDESCLVHSVPVRFQGEDVGEVNVTSSWALDPADRNLLAEIAGAASGAVAAAHRTSELQLARQELVIAKEQERRRIARDVHDGVGPIISGLGFTLDALSGRVEDNPPIAKVVEQARTQVREAGVMIRRVSRELRPTMVDQLGLQPALRELAAQFHDTGLSIELQIDIVAEALNPATEVAAYAIASEAITNVARHAAASRCLLTLISVSGYLIVTVEDDGHGLDGRPPGVGRLSMVERAVELGGSLTISVSEMGGVRVQARLPVEEKTDLPGQKLAFDRIGAV